MAAFNVSADDSSPLISYSPAGAWTDSPVNDQSAQSYSQKTWHTVSSQGASATVQFNGTGVWFFGATRPGYGTYNISVDGQSVSGNAQAQTASFQQLLGGQSSLTNGPHTAVFTNTGSTVDLDSVIFETQIGSSASATVTNTTTDDTSPAINYLPSSGDWALLTSLEGNFNNTLHFTKAMGAQAQFTFDGDAVAVYGTVSPDQADYTVTVDEVKRDFLGGSNGLASDLHEDTLLYFSNNLASQSHNLTLNVNPDQPNNTMDIDRIVVFTASNGTDSTSPDNTTSQSDPGSTTQNPEGNSVNKVPNDPKGSHHSKRLGHIAIGAFVAGILIFVLLLFAVLAVVLIRRWRRRTQQNKTPPTSTIRTPTTPTLPIQTPSTPDIGPLSPMWGFGPHDPLSDPSSLEKGPTPLVSAVQSAPDVNSFAYSVETRSPPAVMWNSRDDGRLGQLQTQSSMSSAPVRPLRPHVL
ncbi:hypothetical protein EDB84DRAFT_1459256 [Lactarius hengduanensis]|nr:hypothetical protein EDB84DRAFT_1459256 [Lactarius hengduanensis]